MAMAMAMAMPMPMAIAMAMATRRQRLVRLMSANHDVGKALRHRKIKNKPRGGQLYARKGPSTPHDFSSLSVVKFPPIKAVEVGSQSRIDRKFFQVPPA
jgi:hypothetical protein